jgi:hypothetical protein
LNGLAELEGFSDILGALVRAQREKFDRTSRH